MIEIDSITEEGSDKGDQDDFSDIELKKLNSSPRL